MVCFTKHLYEKTEVELSFQCAALEGNAEEAVYWLLELCESGWVEDGWKQLWTCYYDFYAVHNPQFECELLELMKLRGKRGQLKMVPLLHGASALIGRRRSVAAWLIREGVLARVTSSNNSISISLSNEGGARIESITVAEQPSHQRIMRMLLGPVEATEELASVLREYSNSNDEKLWEIYRELAIYSGTEPRTEVWRTIPVNKLHIVSALLVFINDELSTQDDAKLSSNLDLSKACANRRLVSDALDLLTKTKSTSPRDQLLLWRQYSPRREIGCLAELPRWKEGEELGKSLRYGQDWLKFTCGCPFWTRIVRVYKGKRDVNGQVVWLNEQDEERFCAERDYDTEELPLNVLLLGSNLFPKGNKLQWLKKMWNVRPRPDIWTQLLQP